jgi:phosphoribosylanthranilate isomerase
MRTRVKICCISSLEEALYAVSLGADALGLVGEMPSGPGIISNDEIAYIAQHVPPPIATFLLTSETQADAIIAHHEKVKTTTIQLVDTVKEETYRKLRLALPGIKLVQVIHVLDEASVLEALSIANHVDALLLDSGNPNLKVKELGGTGRVHNWLYSKQIVSQSQVPVFLAGGLNASNVHEAIREIGPFGLDLCSGVRSHGKLDQRKLEAFMQQVSRTD